MVQVAVVHLGKSVSCGSSSSQNVGRSRAGSSCSSALGIDVLKRASSLMRYASGAMSRCDEQVISGV